MIKKEVKYTDYNGEQKTKVLYFHLSKFEWLELETFTKGGLIENLQRAIESENAKKTIDILKKIILVAYGEKNEDTGAFEKSEDIAIKFSKTEMFSELFYDLAYNEQSAKDFFMGLIPPDIQAEAQQKMAKKNEVSYEIIDTN